MGSYEAATILKVTGQNFCNLHQRHPAFPPPRALLKCGPVWDKADIEEFAVNPWFVNRGKGKHYPKTVDHVELERQLDSRPRTSQKSNPSLDKRTIYHEKQVRRSRD